MYDEFELDDAYWDWEEAIYLKKSVDEIDRREKYYYQLFQEISSMPDFYTQGLKL